MNKHFSLSIAGSIVLLISLAGCNLAEVEPERIIYPGEIRREMAPPHHEMAPPHEDARVDIAGHTVSGPRWMNADLYEGVVSVPAGVPFDVTVHTFASPKCQQVEPSDVEIAANEATIVVFDSWPGPPDDPPPCPAVEGFLPRTESVVFSEAGDAEVVVRGDRMGGGRHPYELRFPVLVED